MQWNFQVTVLQKKAPSTLIDDCIDKFRQHEVERKRLRLLNGQRGSTESAPVEFIIGEDPLSSALNESREDTESPGVEDLMAGGSKRIYCKSVYSKLKTKGNQKFKLLVHKVLLR